MKVFLTGSTGYIGGIVARELIKSGHHVLGLVRNVDSPNCVPGVMPTTSELFSTDWMKLALSCDVFIHCAWDNSMNYEEFAVKEEHLLLNLLDQAQKTPDSTLTTAILTTSGYAVLNQKEPDENAPTDKVEPWQIKRFEAEKKFLDAGKRPGNDNAKVRTVVIRPSWIYGNEGGCLKVFAKMKPFVINGGNQVMSLCNALDLGRLYVLVMTNQRCIGVFHAASEYTTWKAFMTALSKAASNGQQQQQQQVVDLNLEQGIKEFGNLAMVVSLSLRLEATRPEKFGFRFNEPKLMPNFERFYREANSI